MGGGEVFVCRLKEDNSNLYLDGSQANLTGPEGDVMVVFLEIILLIMILTALTSMSRNLLLEHIKDMYL